MRQTLSATDRLVVRKNLEISELNSRLAAKDKIIAEANEQIEKLESELADRPQTPSKIFPAVKTDFKALDAADLLNKLRARKKSKADLRDMEALLEILNQEI